MRISKSSFRTSARNKRQGLPNISQPNQNSYPRLLPCREEYTNAFEFSFHYHQRREFVADYLCGTLPIDGLEVIKSQETLGLIHMRNLLQDFNGLSVATLGNQEFGGLFEAKGHKSKEKGSHSETTEGEYQVSPTHIAVFGTTCLTGSEARVTAGLQRVVFAEIRAAGVCGDVGVRKRAAENDAHGLEDAEQR